jgi:ribonuclease-3
VTNFVHNLFDNLTNWEEVLRDTNYKDQILRFCQTNSMELPLYEINSVEGPPHDRTFEMKIVVGGKILGFGSGKKKGDAEQKAAQQSLLLLKK